MHLQNEPTETKTTHSRRGLSLVLFAIVNTEAAGKPWSLWWWIDVFDLSKVNSWRRWKWALQSLSLWSYVLTPWPFLHVHRVAKYKWSQSVFGCTWKPLISRPSYSCLCHFPIAYILQNYVQRQFRSLLAQIFPSVCVISTFHGKWIGNWFTFTAIQHMVFDPTPHAFLQHVQPQCQRYIWTDSPKCLSLVWERVVWVRGVACNLICKRLQINPSYSTLENYKETQNLS